MVLLQARVENVPAARRVTSLTILSLWQVAAVLESVLLGGTRVCVPPNEEGPRCWLSALPWLHAPAAGTSLPGTATCCSTVHANA